MMYIYEMTLPTLISGRQYSIASYIAHTDTQLHTHKHTHTGNYHLTGATLQNVQCMNHLAMLFFFAFRSFVRSTSAIFATTTRNVIVSESLCMHGGHENQHDFSRIAPFSNQQPAAAAAATTCKTIRFANNDSKLNIE